MTLLKLSNISCYYANKEVLHDVNIEVNEGARIGLIGENGSGKSTILKIICQELKPDSGIVYSLPNLKISKLDQKAQFRQDTVIKELKNEYSELQWIENRMRELEELMSSSDNQALLREYSTLLERFQSAEGYQYEHNIDVALRQIGWDDTYFDKNVLTLSGGEKARLQLAKILLLKPKLLLMDEPSNHMDIETKKWLKEFINDFNGSILIVSHDRDLLDSTCNEIIELDFGETMHFPGNYTFYKKEKEIFIKSQKAIYRKQQSQIAQLKSEINSRQSWFARSLRSTDAQGNELRREEKHHMRGVGAKQAKIVKSKEKQLEKLYSESINYPSDKHKIRISFNNMPQIGSELLTFKNMSKSYGELSIFHDVNISIQSGHKYSLYGANGSGKSTLIKMVIGHERPTKGEVILGKSIKAAYLDQELDSLDLNNSAFDELSNIKRITVSQARYLLARLHIYGDKATRSMNHLSIGERMLVAITKLLVDDYNLLILDEPTNHLDIKKREVIEEALSEYPGTVIFVSHDEYFARAIADKVLYIENKDLLLFQGDYDFFTNSILNKENIQSIKLNEELLTLKMKLFTLDQKEDEQEINQIKLRLQELQNI
jgi:ATP-binding cassette subfamily F protein 3